MRKYHGLFPSILLSLALTFQFFSGHVQPMYISLIFILFDFSANKFSYWKYLIFSAVTTLLLSMLQFFPSFQLSQSIENTVWENLARNYSFFPKNVVNFLMPNFFGNIIDGTFTYPDNPSYFFERNSVYIGLIPFLLASTGLITYIKTKKLYFPILSFLGFFLSMGLINPIYHKLYLLVPGWINIRAPARFIFLTIFALTAMLPICWDKYFGKTSKYLKIFMLFIILFDLFLWNKKYIFLDKIDSYRQPDPFGQIIDPNCRIITDPQIPANKSMLYHHYNVNGYETVILQDFTKYLALQEERFMDISSLSRIDLYAPVSRGFAAVYEVLVSSKSEGLPVLVTSHGLQVYKTFNPQRRIYFPKTIFSIKDADFSDETDYLRKTRSCPQDELLIHGLPNDLSRVFPGGTINSASFSSDRIKIQLTLGSDYVVALEDMFYSGWQAASNNVKYEVQRANKIFRAVILKKGIYTGKNSLYIYFWPFSWIIGLYISVLCILGLMIAIFLKIIKYDLYNNTGL
jgi:hypothetical protein